MNIKLENKIQISAVASEDPYLYPTTLLMCKTEDNSKLENYTIGQPLVVESQSASEKKFGKSEPSNLNTSALTKQYFDQKLNIGSVVNTLTSVTGNASIGAREKQKQPLYLCKMPSAQTRDTTGNVLTQASNETKIMTFAYVDGNGNNSNYTFLNDGEMKVRILGYSPIEMNIAYETGDLLSDLFAQITIAINSCKNVAGLYCTHDTVNFKITIQCCDTYNATPLLNNEISAQVFVETFFAEIFFEPEEIKLTRIVTQKWAYPTVIKSAIVNNTIENRKWNILTCAGPRATAYIPDIEQLEIASYIENIDLENLTFDSISENCDVLFLMTSGMIGYANSFRYDVSNPNDITYDIEYKYPIASDILKRVVTMDDSEEETIGWTHTALFLTDGFNVTFNRQHVALACASVMSLFPFMSSNSYAGQYPEKDENLFTNPFMSWKIIKGLVGFTPITKGLTGSYPLCTFNGAISPVVSITSSYSIANTMTQINDADMQHLLKNSNWLLNMYVTTSTLNESLDTQLKFGTMQSGESISMRIAFEFFRHSCSRSIKKCIDFIESDGSVINESNIAKVLLIKEEVKRYIDYFQEKNILSKESTINISTQFEGSGDNKTLIIKIGSMDNPAIVNKQISFTETSLIFSIK